MTTATERFWQRVERRSDNECWPWIGGLNGYGYGRFSLKERGRIVPAHRFAYEELVGPIPEGLTLDHLCRNRACVNPAHLEPVTNRENILRGEAPPAQNARKTECSKGHPFTEENTTWVRLGTGRVRRCRECDRVARRKRTEREQAYREVYEAAKIATQHAARWGNPFPADIERLAAAVHRVETGQ